jgi:hypothetical protein
MSIHLPCDGEPFCGAELRAGDFLSEVEPAADKCHACLLVSAMAMGEAIVRAAEKKDDMRQVRAEILQVGLLNWKPRQ